MKVAVRVANECRRALIAKTRGLPTFFLVCVLSDHSIILRKCTPGWRGCNIVYKGGFFFTPPKLVTSFTWGPPPPCKQALSYASKIYVRLHARENYASTLHAGAKRKACKKI